MVNRVDRRSFLTRMIGGAAALAVMPRLDAIAAANPVFHADDVAGPVWAEIYNIVLAEAWRGFSETIRPFVVSTGSPLQPYSIRDGIQFIPLGVEMLPDDNNQRPSGAFYAGEFLAGQCNEKSWNAFAPPLIPRNVEVALTAHNVLRYVRCWNPVESRMIDRIDVYGGSQ